MENDESTQDERFEIVKVLGKGAYGKVYHVRDHKKDGQSVALKVLEGTTALDKHTRDRFIKEILILTTISHKNLVNAFEIVNFKGKDGYTMEFISGQDLGSVIDNLNGQQLSNDKITTIMTQLLSALAELHRLNIIHRDIKLDNIMLGHDGIVKLNDLGLAKILSDSPITDPGLILGTAHYMSPEYILKKTIDHRADLYAAGVILWELMHGKRRFEENTEKVLLELIDTDFKHPCPPSTPENELHCRILKKALALNVNERFQSAEEMKEAFYGNLKESNFLTKLKSCLKAFLST